MKKKCKKITRPYITQIYIAILLYKLKSKTDLKIANTKKFWNQFGIIQN